MPNSALGLGLMELAAFGVLALLGYACWQVLLWEATFRRHRQSLLSGLRTGNAQLRQVRRQLDRLVEHPPQLPLNPTWRRGWQVGGWILRTLTARSGG